MLENQLFCSSWTSIDVLSSYFLCSYNNLSGITCYCFQELKRVLHDVPEIVELVGSEDVEQVLNVTEHDGEEKSKASLQSIFSRLMSANKSNISDKIDKLKIRLNMENKVCFFSLIF